MGKVNEFQGQYRFLSNFWPVKIELDGEIYPSVEHAFQAAKTVISSERKAIREVFMPAIAKKLGKRVTLRFDWELVKVQVMKDLLAQKFNDLELKKLLKATNDMELEEGNYWGDTYWGVCRGVGMNMLGKLLMEVRKEIQIDQ